MKLLDVCKIGGSQVKKFYGKKKYIATGDVIKNKIVSYENITFLGKPSRANVIIDKNDVLFAKMQNTVKVIKATQNNIKNVYSSGFYSLTPNSNISQDYLYYFLNSRFFNEQKNKNCIGATQKAINNEGLNNIIIKNIPSLEKQREIVYKLSKLEKLIELKSEEIIKFNEIIQSQFVEMFGDIKNKKYKVKKLKNLTNLITDGEHKKPNYIDKGKPFISVQNITTGELKFDNCKFISKKDAIRFQKRCNPKKDDILYSKVGATYGRSAIVNTKRKFSLYVSVCLIKPKKQLINPIFLNYTMKQPYVKAQADKCVKGIGVPDLHLIEIKNFNIIVPPINLQNKFARFVKKVDKQKEYLKKQLKILEELQSILMQEYFG